MLTITGGFDERLYGACVSAQRSRDDPGALERPLPGVEMRVRPVQRRHRALLDHALRHVRVQIERDAERGVRADGGPDTGDELTVGVQGVLGNRRPVLREQHRIPGAVPAEQLEELVREPLERVGGHDTHRVRLRERQRHDLEVEPLRGREVAAHRRLRSGERRDERLAAVVPALLELPVSRPGATRKVFDS